MHQLDLPYFAPTCVRGVLDAYLAMRAETCTEATIRDDYRYRIDWLVQVFGELTPACEVTYDALERAARAGRAVLLRDVTIRKRLRFWLSACKYAALRGLDAPVLEAPPWLRDDGARLTDFYTPVQFAAFRLALPPGRFRAFADLGMWTGMHTKDLLSMESGHLDPMSAWPDGRQGAWLRRNHKNRKCQPAWMPMEPELLALVPELAPLLPLGGLNNIARAFATAAARAELPPIRANLGLRASHATELAKRGHPYEYIRQVLGHEGEVSRGAGPIPQTAKRPSTLSRHYLRTWGRLK